jgi:N-acetyltransferase
VTTLTGRLVRLEPLSQEHAEAIVAAVESSPPSHFALGATPAPDLVSVQRWIAAAQQDAELHGTVPFATVRIGRGPDRVVGSSRLWQVQWWDWPQRSLHGGRTTPDVCEIGHTWVTEDSVATGVNIEAKLLMLGLAFDEWDVHRVSVRTDVRNAASRRAILALGAQLDGVVRADKLGADATVRDTAAYSIVKAEWPGVQEKLRARLARHLLD